MDILKKLFARRSSGQPAPLDSGTSAPLASPLLLDQVFPLGSHNVQHTYVSRPKAESSVRDGLRHSNAIIQFSGPSKSGKTVLAKRFSGDLPRAHIHAFGTMTQDEFWEKLKAAINAPDQVQISETDTTRTSKLAGTSSTLQAQGGVIGGNVERKRESVEENGRENGRVQLISLGGRVGVLEHLKKYPHTIIIDDFHWMNRSLFPDIFPPLKEALGAGSKLILISVSKQAFPSVGDLADFTGRVLSVEMPPWKHDEIQQIAQLGFEKMNVSVPKETIIHLASCSYFSPLLMQGLCNTLCHENGINQSAAERVTINAYEQKKVGELASRFARPLTSAFDSIITQNADRKWRTKDKDDRLLSMSEVFVLAISHTRPFEPFTLDAMIRRIENHILHRATMPENMAALLASKAIEIQTKLGGEKGDRSPIYYDATAKSVTIVDPYFKLWARWVRGKELGGKLFPE